MACSCSQTMRMENLPLTSVTRHQALKEQALKWMTVSEKRGGKKEKFKFHFHHAEDEFTAEILLLPLSKMNINILHQTQRSGWN